MRYYLHAYLLTGAGTESGGRERRAPRMCFAIRRSDGHEVTLEELFESDLGKIELWAWQPVEAMALLEQIWPSSARFRRFPTDCWSVRQVWDQSARPWLRAFTTLRFPAWRVVEFARYAQAVHEELREDSRSIVGRDYFAAGVLKERVDEERARASLHGREIAAEVVSDYLWPICAGHRPIEKKDIYKLVEKVLAQETRKGEVVR